MVKDVAKHGYINYFGTQRVGLPSKRIRSPHIGLALILEQWKHAINLILSMKLGENFKVRWASWDS